MQPTDWKSSVTIAGRMQGAMTALSNAFIALNTAVEQVNVAIVELNATLPLASEIAEHIPHEPCMYCGHQLAAHTFLEGKCTVADCEKCK